MATNRSVYFIEAVGLNAIKIGVADDVNHRLMELQCASPAELRIVDCVPGDEKLEKSIHKKLRHLHIRGEWFANTIEVKEIIVALQGGTFSGIKPQYLKNILAEVRILKRAGRSQYQVEWRDAVTWQLHSRSTGETNKRYAESVANQILAKHASDRARVLQSACEENERLCEPERSIGKFEHVC